LQYIAISNTQTIHTRKSCNPQYIKARCVISRWRSATYIYRQKCHPSP